MTQGDSYFRSQIQQKLNTDGNTWTLCCSYIALAVVFHLHYIQFLTNWIFSINYLIQFDIIHSSSAIYRDTAIYKCIETGTVLTLIFKEDTSCYFQSFKFFLTSAADHFQYPDMKFKEKSGVLLRPHLTPSFSRNYKGNDDFSKKSWH